MKLLKIVNRKEENSMKPLFDFFKLKNHKNTLSNKSLYVSEIDKIGSSHGNIWSNGAYNATPVIIACYTSRLEISAGLQILTYT
jgi:hypothetical protein